MTASMVRAPATRPAAGIVARIRAGIIGVGEVLDGPYGPRRITSRATGSFRTELAARRGRPDGTQRLGLTADAPPLLASARSARARRTYDRIMTDLTPPPQRRTGRPGLLTQTTQATRSPRPAPAPASPKGSIPAAPGMPPHPPTARKPLVSRRPLSSPEISRARQPSQPGCCQLPATRAEPRTYTGSRSPKSLNGRLRDRAKASGCPTETPQVRVPGRPTRSPLFSRRVMAPEFGRQRLQLSYGWGARRFLDR